EEDDDGGQADGRHGDEEPRAQLGEVVHDGHGPALTGLGARALLEDGDGTVLSSRVSQLNDCPSGNCEGGRGFEPAGCSVLPFGDGAVSWPFPALCVGTLAPWSGSTSVLTADRISPWISVDHRRNSAIAFPTWRPASGSFFGPSTSRATTRITMISMGPRLGMEVESTGRAAPGNGR